MENPQEMKLFKKKGWTDALDGAGADEVHDPGGRLSFSKNRGISFMKGKVF